MNLPWRLGSVPTEMCMNYWHQEHHVIERHVCSALENFMLCTKTYQCPLMGCVLLSISTSIFTVYRRNCSLCDMSTKYCLWCGMEVCTRQQFLSSFTPVFLSDCFNGHFPGGSGLASTWMSSFWILLELRMTCKIFWADTFLLITTARSSFDVMLFIYRYKVNCTLVWFLVKIFKFTISVLHLPYWRCLCVCGIYSQKTS